MKKYEKDKYPLLFKSKNDDIDLSEHYKKAWREARRAANILKKEYGAKDVWIFGSLTDKNRFNLRSDIDLAEMGIADKKFYSAVAGVTRVIKDFKIDLVDKEDCRQTIRNAIEKEGIKL